MPGGELDRVERELESLLAQRTAADVPAWAALLSQRHRLLMKTTAAAERLHRSQELTSRLSAYLRGTREADSAQLAALQRTAALHEALCPPATGEAPGFSFQG
jgi:hypothetical protein